MRGIYDLPLTQPQGLTGVCLTSSPMSEIASKCAKNGKIVPAEMLSPFHGFVETRAKLRLADESLAGKMESFQRVSSIFDLGNYVITVIITAILYINYILAIK